MRNSIWLLLISFVLAVGFTACDSDDNGEDTETEEIVIEIDTTELTDGRVLMDYNETLEASDAEGDVTWSVTKGDLPSGLELADDGTISGTPEKSGVYDFTVQAEDSLEAVEAALSITIPKVLLLSGYSPFGSYETNPSYDAAIMLDEEIIADLDVRVIEIPVTWADGWVELLAAIDELTPDVVIATGVAGTDYMRIETLGKNVMYGADNDDVNKRGDLIVKDGPKTVPGGLPAQEMSDAMNEAGYTTKISDNASRYLCNFALYNVMYYIEYEAEYEIVGGFIHVPPAPTDNFEIEDIAAAHRVGIEALAEWMETGKAAGENISTVHTAPVYFN